MRAPRTEAEIKERIQLFPGNSIIRNLFLCEVLFEEGLFRGATITKQGAEYLNNNKKVRNDKTGFQWWVTPIPTDLSCLEKMLERHFTKNGLEWGIPSKFLHRWRQ